MSFLQRLKRGSTVWLVCKAHEAAGLRRPVISVVSISPVRANRVRALFHRLRNLVVPGSNPGPASNITRLNKFNSVVKNALRNVILAVYWCKNQINNVEKTGLNWASFLKRREFYSVHFSDAPPPVLAASKCTDRYIPFVHGVCGFQ